MNFQDKAIEDFYKALKRFREGKMARDDFSLHIAAANTVQRQLANEILTAKMAIDQRKAYNILKQKGIVDETAAVDIGDNDHEAEKVKCPIRDELIIRADCIDYSGDTKNFDTCDKCEIGIATKELLL